MEYMEEHGGKVRFGVVGTNFITDWVIAGARLAEYAPFSGRGNFCLQRYKCEKTIACALGCI